MLKILEYESTKTLKNKQMSLVDVLEPEIKIVEKEVFVDSVVEQKLKKIDVNNLTPIDALNLLNELK
jgi:DNA mismatch repair ATPase MutS